MSAGDGTYDPSRSGARIDQDEIIGRPATPPDLLRFYPSSEGRYPRMEFAPPPPRTVAPPGSVTVSWRSSLGPNGNETTAYYPVTDLDRALLAWAKLPWWRRMITARPTSRLARFARR